MHPRLRLASLIHVSLFTLGFVSSSHLSYAAIVIGDAPLNNNPQISYGLPLSTSATTVTISRKQYVLNWDYEKRTAEWVAWLLNDDTLGNVKRTNSFRLDHDLDEALGDMNRQAVRADEYKGSCFDRGHQVPSGDRTATKEDNQITFYMSNIIPQTAYLNRRTWASLETFLRREVTDNGLAFQIYAGVIPAQDKNHIMGSHEDIEVPSMNFKIAVLMPGKKVQRKDSTRFFVVNFPNVTSKGSDPVNDHDQACEDSKHTGQMQGTNHDGMWRKFLTRLRNVEKASGIDFPFLHDAHEMTATEVDQLINESRANKKTLVGDVFYENESDGH